MLKSLSIRNVVLIDKLDLDFASGLNVFSGETGAGKSILLDSLGLILGNRAETSLIRQGADKLTVSGSFEIADKNNPFFKLCAENDLEIDDEIIIKRSLSTDGKGKRPPCRASSGMPSRSRVQERTARPAATPLAQAQCRL